MTEAERAELASQRHTELLDLVTKTHNGVESVKVEVAELSTNFALHEQDDKHVHGGHDNRLSSLEEAATATGQHKIVRLEGELEETRKAAKADAEKWKGRAWSIFAALLLATLTAFAGAYFGQ